jgi:hypothetical protein
MAFDKGETRPLVRQVPRDKKLNYVHKPQLELDTETGLDANTKRYGCGSWP